MNIYFDFPSNGTRPTKTVVCELGDNGCWNNISHNIGTDGYPNMVRKGAYYLMSHAFYIKFIGPIPDSMQVLHRCDNRQCVNPEHLFLGTNEDNVRDRVAKGRSGAAYGETCHLAVLTRESVIAIRTLRRNGASLKAIADKFGVSVPTVSHVALRDTWKHIPEEALV